MPCDTRLRQGQTLESRNQEITTSLRSLEMRLQSGTVTVEIGPTGAIALKGWKAEERTDITDVCAYRTLASQNSWALRQAVAKAEARSGRKVNPHAVAAGTHSHDGGGTWHKGH